MLRNLDLYLRRHKLPTPFSVVAFRVLVIIVSPLFLFLFLPLSPSTTALRKLVNPARNCESTRTSRVENDRSNRAFGTRFLPKIADTRTDIHTHTKRDANLQL